jgi:ABC-type multidrug transport system fused ATPase/permease subunit
MFDINKQKKDGTGAVLHIVKDLISVYKFLNKRRHQQLIALLVLQVTGAMLEVLSIGAVLPFLGALSNAEKLMAMPQLEGFMNFFGIASPTSLTVALAAGFAAAIVIANAFRILLYWLQSRLMSAIGTDLSTEIFRRNLCQSFELHAKNNSGSLISTIANDFAMAIGCVSGAVMLVTQGLLVLAVFAAVIALDAQLALIIGAILTISYLTMARYAKIKLQRNSWIISDSYRKMVKALQEGLGGIRDVLLDGSQDRFVREYRSGDMQMRRAGASTAVIRIIPRYVLEAAGVVAMCLLTSVMVMREGSINDILPLLGGLAMAATRLLPATQQIYSSVAGMQGSHVSLRRILKELTLEIDPINVMLLDKIKSVSNTIELDDVWFRYPKACNIKNEDWILRGANLKISVNTTVALVGPSGGGKSTIADILMGLLFPQQGALKIDGSILVSDEVSSWRRNIAHVPQSIYLSDASIKENIAFGVPIDQIDMQRVRQATKYANISDFIESKPGGYDVIVGERGVRLSGGQRQRIGIARALYKNAEIIIFDEATSALDNMTEKEVMRAVENLSGKVTVVLIAHRLSTIQHADEIFVVEDGKICSHGTYEYLLGNSEAFRQLALKADEKGNQLT